MNLFKALERSLKDDLKIRHCEGKKTTEWGNILCQGGELVFRTESAEWTITKKLMYEEAWEVEGKEGGNEKPCTTSFTWKKFERGSLPEKPFRFLGIMKGGGVTPDTWAKINGEWRTVNNSSCEYELYVPINEIKPRKDNAD